MTAIHNEAVTGDFCDECEVDERVVRFGDRNVAVRLSRRIWASLDEISDREGVSTDDIVNAIASDGDAALSLGGTVPVFLTSYWRSAAGDCSRVDRQDE